MTDAPDDAGVERVPWNELANLIEDNFDVSYGEASALADNALGSEWRDHER